MASQPEFEKRKPKRRAIPLPLILLANLVLFVLSVAALYGTWKLSLSRATVVQREHQAFEKKEAEAQIAERKTQNDARVAFAREQLVELLRTLRDTTNSLFSAMTTMAKVRAEVSDLRTNDVGRVAAQFPELIERARNVFKCENEAFPSQEVFAQRLETARRREFDVNESLDSGFVPEKEFYESVQDAFAWADTQARNTIRLEGYVNGLIREAKGKVFLGATPLNPPTLEEAAPWYPQPAARVPNNTPSLDAYLPKRDPEYIWLVSLLADSHVSARDKALNTRLRAALAPFLEPGYFFPGRVGTPFADVSLTQRRPMSYSRLKNLGALKPGQPNMLFFVSVATNPINDRPHFRKAFSQLHWDDDPDLNAEAHILQMFMLRLGPTYVELQLMDP